MQIAFLLFTYVWPPSMWNEPDEVGHQAKPLEKKQ